MPSSSSRSFPFLLLCCSTKITCVSFLVSPSATTQLRQSRSTTAWLSRRWIALAVCVRAGSVQQTPPASGVCVRACLTTRLQQMRQQGEVSCSKKNEKKTRLSTHTPVRTARAQNGFCKNDEKIGKGKKKQHAARLWHHTQKQVFFLVSFYLVWFSSFRVFFFSFVFVEENQFLTRFFPLNTNKNLIWNVWITGCNRGRFGCVSLYMMLRLCWAANLMGFSFLVLCEEEKEKQIRVEEFFLGAFFSIHHDVVMDLPLALNKKNCEALLYLWG